MVFNIQRFSVNDGPGIRTTVFLKGCPLHCRWCHNPESISPKQELILREDRCVRCGDCKALCTNEAISVRDGDYVTSRELCKVCGDCVKLCYAEAREVVGKEMTIQEVVTEIDKDAVFFTESEGGVSFSGGEPLLQHEFLLSLLKVCKHKGYHTAVDTTGFTSQKILEKVIPDVDLFLYDLKTLDDTKHIEYTGVSNHVILENLGFLVRHEKNIIVRIPVIPGVNDSSEELARIGSFVKELGGIREIQILPYHKTGIDKYVRLGKEYRMADLVPPPCDEMNEFANELGSYCSRISIGG